MYPLDYLRKMLDQVRSIQASVQAEGMKEEERIDWNGVKMQFFRIFQQEQFIFKVQGGGSEGKALEYYAGTRSPKAPLKRFLFTLNSGTITSVMQQGIIEKSYCVIYLMSGSKIQGFIHLKEYTELSEVAELLDVNTEDMEVCEVRGRTEDIIKGTVQVKLRVDLENNKMKWGPCESWSEACNARKQELDQILTNSHTEDCPTCGGEGTVPCIR